MTPDPLDIWIEVFAPPIMALAYAIVLWSYMRMIVRGGRPLTPVMRGMIKYGFVWALGSGYLMSIGKAIGWSMRVWFELIAGWSVLAGGFAWWRHKRKQVVRTP